MSFSAILSVARKECLHIVRDWRILLVLLLLPPAFTLMFGYAFEVGAKSGVPTLVADADGSPHSGRLMEQIARNKTFAWRKVSEAEAMAADPYRAGVRGILLIPKGWGAKLAEGDPQPLLLTLDTGDINTALELEGALKQSLGEFQMNERQQVIDELPEEVFEMGRKLPVTVRRQFTSLMTPWEVKSKYLYNPDQRFIEFVLPGIIGLILQLLTVTLTACTIVRERESGTYAQLMVTSLSRGEIVIGKMLPYLAISVLMVVVVMAVGGLHFAVKFRGLPELALICLLFLLSSLGLGLIISALCRTQTQAIQVAVFFLMPVFVLSGAFAPLDQLPAAVAAFSELFPLTHFCRAFRIVSMYQAPFSAALPDLLALLGGIAVTFGGATWLLTTRRSD